MLALIDVVMISNLLIMVIVGGYETFVSRMDLEGHPDQPEWLSHVNASVLKVKLATAIIGISSIHLLKTFINAANYTDKVLLWQTVIHVAFLFSALAIALTDRLLRQPGEGSLSSARRAGGRGQHQRHAQQRRHQRAAEHAELELRLVDRILALEGQAADEQAHREADAAQHAHGEELAQRRAGREARRRPA